MVPQLSHTCRGKVSPFGIERLTVEAQLEQNFIAIFYRQADTLTNGLCITCEVEPELYLHHSSSVSLSTGLWEDKEGVMLRSFLH